MALLGDFGTTWTKLLDTDTGMRHLHRTKEVDGVVVEVATGKEIKSLEGHSQWVRSVCFSPNGKIIASGAQDNTIKIWSAASGQEMESIPAHTEWVHSLSFSRDGKLLASGSCDGTVKIWKVNSR